MLFGIFAILGLPREEEPQIVVPMVDVFAAMPGASPVEIEQRLSRPIEKIIWEIPVSSTLLDIQPGSRWSSCGSTSVSPRKRRS